MRHVAEDNTHLLLPKNHNLNKKTAGKTEIILKIDVSLIHRRFTDVNLLYKSLQGTQANC